MIRSFPPNPLPPGERVGHSSPPAELGGILAYFDKSYLFSAYNIIKLKAIVNKKIRKEIRKIRK